MSQTELCGFFPSGIEYGTDNVCFFCSCVNVPGYSVAVAHTEYGPLYVAGAPRHSMSGKVLVFQDGHLKQTLQGEQVLGFTHQGLVGWTHLSAQTELHFLLQTHLDLARCILQRLCS